MSNKKDKVTIEVNANIYLKVIYPELLYTVQNSLSKRGIHFVDLNTGFLITGNMNIDTLGMISKKSLKKPAKNAGNTAHFLVPQKIKKVYNIEATINIYEPQDEKHPVIFTIQIIDENDLEFWQKIFIEIGQNHLYQKPSGEITSDVVFHLIPLTLPNPKDPQSVIKAMLDNIQKYQTSDKSSLDLLPGYAYPSFDSGYGDEGLDP